MSNNLNVLIVGTGPIGQEYAKILDKMNIKYSIVCRSFNSTLHLKKISSNVYHGGVENFLKKNKSQFFSHAIIAVSVIDLSKITKIIIKSHIKNILVEKPCDFSVKRLENLYSIQKKEKKSVFIAYNRRFYSNVIYLKNNVFKNNKIESMTFDFTEWPEKFVNKYEKKILNNWLIINSSHVIDLAFYLAGNPKKLKAVKNGELSWYKNSVFAGTGVTKKNIPFSYHANWDSAGRWKINLFNKEGKWILMPLEKIFFQKKNSLSSKELKIDNSNDIKFKPGFFLQVEAFLKNEKELLTLKNQIEKVKIYKIIERGLTL